MDGCRRVRSFSDGRDLRLVSGFSETLFPEVQLVSFSKHNSPFRRFDRQVSRADPEIAFADFPTHC
jgi:hypothetical protein